MVNGYGVEVGVYHLGTKKMAPTEEAAGASERHPMGWGARGRVPLSLSQAGGLAASIDQDQAGGKQQRGYDSASGAIMGNWDAVGIRRLDGFSSGLVAR